MKYTKFGNTGANVSRLGFGCMRLPTTIINGKSFVDEDVAIKMLRKGYELGINYFDTAYFYHDGMSEVVLGKALKGIRDKVYVSSKSPGNLIKSKDGYRRILEEQLKRLDISYIDFYHFHGINYEEFTNLEEKYGWYTAALKAKEEGLIKHISFSFHTWIPFDKRTKPDEESDHMIRLLDTGYFESVLCQYNVLDQKNKRGMEHAKERGMGVTVMGPLGGGRVSGMPKEMAEKLNIKVAASAELGLRFVASNPNVDIILSGMSNETQLQENAEYVSRITPLSDEEMEGIKTMLNENQKLSDLYCTGCNYCMPCPFGVAIPTIFQQTNYYKIYGIKDYAREAYANIGSEWSKGNRADACTECGLCETKCPQHLKIRDQLKESHLLLSQK